MSRMMLCLCLAGLFSLTLASADEKTNTAKPNGNRLTYLDEPCNPWYPHRDFPKLTTPMWVGEEGVEAVVILGIDDMRGHEKWEAYLRPILNRLKQIDGRAPVSIFTCSIDPKQPHLQQWLEEGLSLEVHTIDHPCPLLQGGSGGRSLRPQPTDAGSVGHEESAGLAKAKSTVDRCIDLLNEVPNNKPVCFRMPCCDSLNTLSPRFYTEIFNKTTAKGNFLLANSSVMQVFTSDDPALPRELVLDANGKEKFKKYLPADRFFANSIENYPYPFVVDRLCWEVPCVAPSDWAAQHFHKPHNPQTVEDWKAALDCTVIKQGVYCLVFHPHNWIKPEQINELIDHAVTKHGKKVKFLNFREAVERLNKNVLGGQSLRDGKGKDNGVRLLDVNNDGFVDVVTGNKSKQETRFWRPEKSSWGQVPFPSRFTDIPLKPDQKSWFDLTRFGVLDNGRSLVSWNMADIDSGTPLKEELAIWKEDTWQPVDRTGWKTELNGDRCSWGLEWRWLDLDGDGICEQLASGSRKVPILGFVLEPCVTRIEVSLKDRCITRHPITWPSAILGRETDAGLRFIDLDEDGHDDIVFSNHERYGIWLWESLKAGWSREVLSGQRGDKPAEQELPPIVRADGSNNGFWVHARQLVWMNEDTAKSKDLVERRSFDQLLASSRRLATPSRPDAKSTPEDKKAEDRSGRSHQPTEDGPKSPEASLKMMQVKPGYRVELVAAEPLVRDPVAFDWGPDGKLWVAEMADYPLGVPDGEKNTEDTDRADQNGSNPRSSASSVPSVFPFKKGGGRVRFLEDTDGDGKYDKSTLFLDKLNFPNGVMPWRDGVLISAAPDVLFARDTNGDGRADEVKVLLTGFGEGNQQHRVNGFSWGLDNMVHCANGDSGGSIRVEGRVESGEKGGKGNSLPTPNSPLSTRTIDIRGRDFRWNPDTGELDPTSGQTDRKSTRLNSSHLARSRMPSSA